MPLGEDRQIDTYFNAPHRDFLAGEIASEWLRLRTETSDHTAERTSINFKRWLPLGAALDSGAARPASQASSPARASSG
jgi:adenylate cyclase class 2